MYMLRSLEIKPLALGSWHSSPYTAFSKAAKNGRLPHGMISTLCLAAIAIHLARVAASHLKLGMEGRPAAEMLELASHLHASTSVANQICSRSCKRRMTLSSAGTWSSLAAFSKLTARRFLSSSLLTMLRVAKSWGLEDASSRPPPCPHACVNACEVRAGVRLNYEAALPPQQKQAEDLK